MPAARQTAQPQARDARRAFGRRVPRRGCVPFAAVAAAVALVSACGTGAAATGASAASTPSATASTGPGRYGDSGPGGPGANGRGNGMSVASGLVAAVDGTTAQVQGNQTQTAVTWSASTAFTQTVPATAAAVKVGTCVMVRTARPAGSATSTAPPAGVQPAVSVVVSAKVNGACAPSGGPRGLGGASGGWRQPGGARPSGLPTTHPTGGETDRFRGARGPGGGAFGVVTAVMGSSITIAAMRPAPNGATGAPTTSTVRTTGATTYSTTAGATAHAVKVGTCVTALGKADDTGTVAAASISVRPAEAGVCTGGFGRPGGREGDTTVGGGAGA
jgi:hypothetical protein